MGGRDWSRLEANKPASMQSTRNNKQHKVEKEKCLPKLPLTSTCAPRYPCMPIKIKSTHLYLYICVCVWKECVCVYVCVVSVYMCLRVSVCIYECEYICMWVYCFGLCLCFQQRTHKTWLSSKRNTFTSYKKPPLVFMPIRWQSRSLDSLWMITGRIKWLEVGTFSPSHQSPAFGNGGASQPCRDLCSAGAGKECTNTATPLGSGLSYVFLPLLATELFSSHHK